MCQGNVSSAKEEVGTSLKLTLDFIRGFHVITKRALALVHLQDTTLLCRETGKFSSLFHYECLQYINHRIF